MVIGIEFWVDDSGNALYPSLAFSSKAQSKYMPYGAKQKVSFAAWKSAVSKGRHKLPDYSVAIAASASRPEELATMLIRANEDLDIDGRLDSGKLKIESVTYHES